MRGIAPAGDQGANGCLPDGDYFGLTWGIPDNFGGLTNALLHRSKAFAEYGGTPVDILTLAPDLEPSAATRRLRESGHLDPRVRLRNLWDELRTAPERDLERLAGGAYRPRSDTDGPLPFSGDLESNRLDARGTVLQVDRFRSDGTRLLSDRRDLKERGVLGGRLLTLYSRSGTPIGQWTSASEFYFSWFDHVIGAGPAFLINDSQFIGRFLHLYRRDNVTVVQVMHSSHLSHSATDPFGRVTAGKLNIIRSLDGFDLVATLTQRQTDDLGSAHLGARTVRTVPNSRDTTVSVSSTPRDPGAGVMLSRLDPAKRVEDAISAVAFAVRNGNRVTLRIYGDGDQRAELDRLIRDLSCSSFVELRGYEAQAAKHFSEASFSVLSSRQEGMPLVLVESMAAGCIPIAYDIRYGPADIITNGVNGFVVADGDVAELARVIGHVSRLDPESLQALRDAAAQRAQEFSDSRVVGLWGEALTSALRAKSPTRQLAVDAKARKISLGPRILEVHGIIQVAPRFKMALRPRQIDAFLAWSERRGSAFGRVPLDVKRFKLSTFRFAGRLPLERFDVLPRGTVDLDVAIVIDGQFRQARLVADRTVFPRPYDRYKVYETKYGNVSLTVFPQKGGPGPITISPTSTATT